MIAPYLAILSSRYRMLLQYRAVALAGIVTQVFWGLIRSMIFHAFYASSSTPQPMTEAQTIAYIWLSQAFLLLTMFTPDSEIAAMINSGHVAYELTRPADLYWLWFFRSLAGRAAPLTLRCLPILALAAVFFGLPAPVSVRAAVLFLLSISLALLLASALITLLSLSLLWTISGQGITALAPAVIYIASGIVIPIPLFPDFVQRILNVLPFRGLIDTPFRIYLGNLSGAGATAAIAWQIGWILGLILLGRAILNRGLKRLVVQGG